VDSGYTERALAFDCNGQTLIGVVAAPARPAERGVLIVVGGPQYRCGSHRQFVLLARHLASHGMASMRFDYRGMGDSTGALRNFEHIEHDIRAAIDQFLAAAPGLTKL
jgi:alpha/beta superfamily hydrolase